MTAREFKDWRLFEVKQPLPDRLADLHNALLCVVATNIMRSEDSQPTSVADFLILKEHDAEPELERPRLTEAEAFRLNLRGY